ncbi:MAG: hypothetical protein R3E01_13035 [Pirellulaceae bacterium]|nr:hypothetical protein [Planctomycetales bacterium]
MAVAVDAAERSRWEVIASDCVVRSAVHRRIRSEDGEVSLAVAEECEQIRVDAGGGTYIYAVSELPPCRVIEELHLGVELNANREGLQVSARVVLPHTLRPDTGKPISFFVNGNMYQRRTAWQRLVVEGLPDAVERQVRVLRSQYRCRIDAREAYVDRLIVNVYGGPGTTEAFLKPPQLENAVAIRRTTGSDGSVSQLADGIAIVDVASADGPDANTVPSCWTLSGEPLSNILAGDSDDGRPVVCGGIAIRGGRPFFARAIDYHGENLAFLKSLGFNTICSAVPYNDRQRREAEELGLWLIVLDRRQQIPSDLSISVRETGVAATDSSGLSDRGLALSPSGETVTWWRIGDQDVASRLRPNAWRAAALGARGIWMESASRLDAPNDAAREFCRNCEWVNRELIPLTPWIAGSRENVEVLSTSTDSGATKLTARILTAARSRLLLIVRDDGDPLQPPTRDAAAPSLVLNEVPLSFDSFQLQTAGLQPIRRQRVTGGVRLQLEQFHGVAAVLLCEDPTIVRATAAELEKQQVRRLRLETEIIRQYHAQMRWESIDTIAYRSVSTTPVLNLEKVPDLLDRVEYEVSRGSYWAAASMLDTARSLLH